MPLSGGTWTRRSVTPPRAPDRWMQNAVLHLPADVLSRQKLAKEIAFSPRSGGAARRIPLSPSHGGEGENGCALAEGEGDDVTIYANTLRDATLTYTSSPPPRDAGGYQKRVSMCCIRRRTTSAGPTVGRGSLSMVPGRIFRCPKRGPASALPLMSSSSSSFRSAPLKAVP